jgi:hypothetical protein
MQGFKSLLTFDFTLQIKLSVEDPFEYYDF